MKLHAVYQTSINAPRQKTQEIVKQACQKAGISVEIKSVTASVFFSSDVANPDTYPHFYCRPPDVHDDDDAAGSRRVHAPVPVHRGCEQGEQVARAATSPAGRTPTTTSCSSSATYELDPVKRAALFIAMNDLVIKDVVVIPVVTRPAVSAVGKQAARPAERLGQQSLRCAGLVSRRVRCASVGS